MLYTKEICKIKFSLFFESKQPKMAVFAILPDFQGLGGVAK